MKGPRSQRPCGPAPRLESPLLWGTPTDLVTRPPCRESYCPGEGFAPGGQCTHSPSALPARVGRRCLLGPWGPPGPKRGGVCISPRAISTRPVRVMGRGREGGSVRWKGVRATAFRSPGWGSSGWQSGTELGKPPNTTQMMRAGPQAGI